MAWPERTLLGLSVALIGYAVGYVILGPLFVGHPEPLKVISKEDLTDQTSVYVIEVAGNRYIIVNGNGKIAIEKQ